MTQSIQSGNRQIKAFEASLLKAIGRDKVPREALGDLSDLLDTLRRGVNMLTGIMEQRRGFERAPAKKLLELEILLSDDLRMIAKDLLPSLRAMRKAAYAVQSGDEQAVQDSAPGGNLSKVEKEKKNSPGFPKTGSTKVKGRRR